MSKNINLMKTKIYLHYFFLKIVYSPANLK